MKNLYSNLYSRMSKMDELEITNERVDPEHLKTVNYLNKNVQGYYLDGTISLVGGFNHYCIDTIVRIIIHESHHYVLEKLFDEATTKKLDNIEDVDNLLFDVINLNFENVRR